MSTQEQARNQFSALQGDFIYLENAGGSQVPDCVVEAMSRFMRESYVQRGAGYPASDVVDATVAQATAFTQAMFGDRGNGEVLFGPSSTALVYVLAQALAYKLNATDEIVISVANHESHIGAWNQLENRGIRLKLWWVDPETGLSNLDELRHILESKPKIVCFTHTSNLLGDSINIKKACRLIHDAGAIAIVDCVASAPHEVLDVEDWGVDFCFFSFYKVYGPHMAAMWGKRDLWESLPKPGHFFLSPYGTARFELGCLNYEGLAGICALEDYMSVVAGGKQPTTRETIVKAVTAMGDWEIPIKDRMMEYLTSHPRLRVFGPRLGEFRHPIFSFVHDAVPSSEIAAKVNQNGIGIRHGHMYAYRLCKVLKVPVEQGVVRISGVHTTTLEEIEKLIQVLEEILEK